MPPLPRKSLPEAKSHTLYECQSTFQLIDRLRDLVSNKTGKPPSFDYRVATEFLDTARLELGFTPTLREIAFATYDQESDAQARFFTALGHRGILVEPIDFRLATPTLPIGADFDKPEHRFVTVIPQLVYAIGLLAGREAAAEVVVVTRCFDVYGPLLDLVKNRNGKAAVAFFRRYLDGRWASHGLFDAGFPIKFIDLEPISRELVGVDLREIEPHRKFTNKGLAGL